MISIISAIYKSERYLPAYLKHAKKFAEYLIEKNVSLEIIIIPTQPSETEKKLLATIKNEPWCVIHEFNQRGLYAAWNEGVSIASGNCIGPWNVDDIRFPEAVIEADQLIQKGAEIVYFPFFIKRYISFGPVSIPVVTRKISGSTLAFEKRRFETCMVAGPHFMFTKKAFEVTGPFDEQFGIAGDFDWCARAAEKNLLFVEGKKFSGVFRVDGHGLSSGANTKLQAENNIIYKRHHAPEKVIKGLGNLEQKYREDRLLNHGDWLKL